MNAFVLDCQEGATGGNQLVDHGTKRKIGKKGSLIDPVECVEVVVEDVAPIVCVNRSDFGLQGESGRKIECSVEGKI